MEAKETRKTIKQNLVRNNKTMYHTVVKKLLETKPDMDVIRQAGQILQTGGLVAFPTETVYGLGANALMAEASRKIYAAKGQIIR